MPEKGRFCDSIMVVLIQNGVITPEGEKYFNHHDPQEESKPETPNPSTPESYPWLKPVIVCPTKQQ